MRPAIATVLLAAVALSATASAALANPAAPAPAAGRVGPAAAAFAPPTASPAGPVELSDGQMDRVRAGGVRVASSPGSRESTLD